MSEIVFSYQITKEDFQESSLLLGKKLQVRGARTLVVVGVALIAIPVAGWLTHIITNPWINGLVLILGLAVLYWGVQSLSPEYVARRYYAATGIAGKEFQARISPAGMQVHGAESEWKYSWAGVLRVKESDRIFAIDTGLQIFTFAKRYLTEAQIVALRQLIAAQPQFPGGNVPKY